MILLIMNEAEKAAIMHRESAFNLYQNGSITLKQGADLCGVDLYNFMTMLSSANIPVIDYSPEELEAEVDCLSENIQTAYFAEKLAEAEREAAKPDAVWLNENEFWSEDD